MMRHNFLRHATGALLAAGVVALSGFPAAQAQIFTGEKEILRESNLEWLEMKRHTPLAPTKRVQSYVECVAWSIIDVLPDEFQSLNWEVVVFDDDTLNAFAMPGGKIGVFTGLLNVADTPAALAAVLGHEIAHLTENHVMERAKKERRNQALVLVGNAATGLGGVIQDSATLFLSLPFGREQESEADLVGLGYMANAGYDPRASLYLWRNMSAAQGDGGPPEWLSTHPSDDRRMDDLAHSMAPALIKYNEAHDAGKRPNCQP